jgi:cytochrome c553
MKKLIALSMLALAANMAAAQTSISPGAKAKLEQCIGCHAIPGYKATFPDVYRVPMLGGQSAKYIENALQAYKKGERKHPSMAGIAKSLTDQDIVELAQYYAAQTAQK